MIKSKKRFSVSLMAALTLMAAGVAGFAQRHFMLSNVARPEVKMQLSAAVERESGAVPLSKDTVVNLGDVLDWTITAENDGNGAAVEYKAVAHIPRGTTFVADSAKADGAKAFYSNDGGKSYSRQPMIEEKQADGSSRFAYSRNPAPPISNEDYYEEPKNICEPSGFARADCFGDRRCAFSANCSADARWHFDFEPGQRNLF